MTSLRRVNYGRGHAYYLDDEKVPGATTVLSKGYPKHLEKWAAEKTWQHAIDYWDELAELPVSERIKRMDGARFADRDQAARRGTEVHGYAQRLQRDEEVDVPDELLGHVDAYLRFLEEWQPQPLLVEAPVASTKWRYCGTLDFLGDVAGERWILDLKTTRSGVFRESALQVTAYRNCDVYLDSNGEIQPLPKVDRCGVIWLRPDRTYEFVPVEAGEAEFRVFLAAMLISRFDAREDVIGAPLEPPAPAVAA